MNKRKLESQYDEILQVMLPIQCRGKKVQELFDIPSLKFQMLNKRSYRHFNLVGIRLRSQQTLEV